MLQKAGERSLVPVQRAATRWGLVGGMVAADIAWAVIATDVLWQPVGPVLGISAVSMLFGATVISLIMHAVRRRRGSLRAMERDLEKASSMMERGLIDQEDYQRIKREVFEGMRLGRVPIERIWPATMWGGIIGLTLPLLIFAANATSLGAAVAFGLGAALAGALASGATAAGYVYVFEHRFDRQLPPGPDSSWRRLGEPKGE